MKYAALAGLGLGLWLGLLGGPVAAADDSRAQLEQRIRLAARLITDSPTSQRITASGNAQAVAHFDESRLHHSMAEDSLKRGDLGAARREVDEALRHVGLARRMVPDAPARQAVARQRHEQMLANLERLIESWRSRTKLGGSEEALDGDLASALGLVATARSLGQAERYEDSLRTLAAAEQHVLSGMKRVLHSRELDYTARASNPAEEFQLELQRNEGLADLVPLAVSELKPKEEAVLLIERYGDASRTLRAQAVQQFQGGDIKAALTHIRNASQNLQRALQAAGLAMPNPTGSSP